MHWFTLCFELLVPQQPSTHNLTFRSSDGAGPPSLLPFPADIFEDQLLPTYRIGTVQSLKTNRVKHRTPAKKNQKERLGTVPAIPQSARTADETPQNSADRGTETYPKAERKASATRCPADWRVGDLSIEWFNMEEHLAGAEDLDPSRPPLSSTGEHDKVEPPIDHEEEADAVSPLLPRLRSLSAKKRQKAHITPTSGAFIPFQCGRTELNAGILHLYRDREEVESVLAMSKIPPPSPCSDEKAERPCEQTEEQMFDSAKGTGTILCILAVPSYMTAQDFLAFVGPMHQDMAHLRIVRDSLPNRYMVLVKFRTRDAADAFYAEYNGREYSSFEAETCHVVYIKNVEFKSHAIPPYAFPPLPDDPSSLFLPSRVANASPAASSGLQDDDGQQPSPSAGSPIKSPLSAGSQLLELPTCPVCLDRMDASVSGLLTIVCHHTFHCRCLSKWGDSSCPVCRYSSKFHTLSGGVEDEDDMPNECMDCGSLENLWICLICGNIGCGRYQRGCAQSHFNETQHLYAMELETQRVWDYAGDGYVHRLIQNRTDGKLVELPAPSRTHSGELDGDGGLGGFPGSRGNDGGPGFGDGMGRANGKGGSADRYGRDGRRQYLDGDSSVSAEKLESLGLEYTYLLTSQLESQRIWYESRLASLESVLASRLDNAEEELERCRAERDELVASRSEQLAQLDKIKNDLKTADERAKRLVERSVAAGRGLVEEKAVTASLLKNQQEYKAVIEQLREEVKQKEVEVSELNEQIRDLMAFLDVRERCQTGDLQGADVLGVPAPPPPPTPPHRRKGKGKK
ncbi:BRCA1-associated protein 2-domain-containing protein [Geranomyces variabilis]|nr:BRCA1-associated protein 2-domain-containing protein [Geranomyces variabilis]KAJ3143408.1 hypothetical protein HDU90_000168 [Geranomyces variabilis]